MFGIGKAFKKLVTRENILQVGRAVSTVGLSEVPNALGEVTGANAAERAAQELAAAQAAQTALLNNLEANKAQDLTNNAVANVQAGGTASTASDLMKKRKAGASSGIASALGLNV